MAILVMESFTTEQRVKVIQTYYENDRSLKTTFRKIRDYFGQHNRPSESGIIGIVRRFEETGSVAGLREYQHLRPARSNENIVAVSENVREQPNTSIRHRSRQLGISYDTVQRLLMGDLHLHAYKIQLTQQLKPLDHLQRRRFVNWVLEKGDDFSSKIIFSDEAHFHLGGYVNKQNCRIWGLENPHVIYEKPIYPPKLTVWCGLWANDIIGPYFFENDDGATVTVNSGHYRNMLREFLWPKLNEMDVNQLWFQQDGSISHTSLETIVLLRSKFDDRIISRNGEVNWAPRSCDLTPLYYFL